MVLSLAALSIVTKSGLASVYNSGVHGFTETLYAYDSQGNNNGSAFAGFGLTNFSADLGTVAMVLGRFVPMFAAANATQTHHKTTGVPRWYTWRPTAVTLRPGTTRDRLGTVS